MCIFEINIRKYKSITINIILFNFQLTFVQHLPKLYRSGALHRLNPKSGMVKEHLYHFPNEHSSS